MNLGTFVNTFCLQFFLAENAKGGGGQNSGGGGKPHEETLHGKQFPTPLTSVRVAPPPPPMPFLL